MVRTIAISILLCFVTFHVGITNSESNIDDEKSSDLTISQAPLPVEEKNPEVTPSPKVPLPEPTQHTTKDPIPVTTKPTTPPTTTAPTTSKPSTTTPPPSSTTLPPSTTSNSSSTSSPPTTTPATTPGPTNATSTASPSTTTAPPTPSDRKFDAFSFLGGFALGLGLVAIGFLSWKFYLSRQENYYHTL